MIQYINTALAVILIVAVHQLHQKHETLKSFTIERAREMHVLDKGNNELFQTLLEKQNEMAITVKFMELEGQMGVMCETVGIRKYGSPSYILRRDDQHAIVCDIDGRVYNYDQLFELYEQVAYEEEGE